MSTTTEKVESKSTEPVDELQELQIFTENLRQKYQDKQDARQLNQQGGENTDGGGRATDSSVKKNTAFVRKVRNFSEAQLNTLLKEASTLNVEKYVSEVAAALTDAKLRMADVPAAVQFCGYLHRRYPEYAKALMDCWSKWLTLRKDEKPTNPTKLKVDLRFFADLITYGVLGQKEALSLLGNALAALLNVDREQHSCAVIIISFCKFCGDDYAGLVPKRMRILAEKYNVEIQKSTMISPEKQRNVKQLLSDYYSSMCQSLIKDHKELLSYEKQNKVILQTKGELSVDRREKLKTMRKSVERLQDTIKNFAEILDVEFPNLETDEKCDESDDITLNMDAENDDGNADLWDDEESRLFYEEFPNVIDCLSRDNEASESKSTEAVEEKSANEDSEIGGTTGTESSDRDDGTDEKSNTKTASKGQLDAFMARLPNCLTKEMVDAAATEYVRTFAHRNRKKLLKTLFTVPRTRLDLLPMYSRFVATINPVMSEVGVELAGMLKTDFRYHVRKKDQINIETKVKIIRFIGELIKFRIFPKNEGLHCLKMLLNDFTHHHIEMACNLLECAGKFLYRSSDTHQRTKVYLEQIMRKKVVMNLDNRYVTMIENAYYQVNPPEVVRHETENLPPLFRFIEHLIYDELRANRDVQANVLQCLRKLNWKDEETANFTVRTLTSAYNLKYQNIRFLANLLAGLVEYVEDAGIRVIDSVYEDIRLGLEMNHPRMRQRRIAMIRYFGELYNYRLIESTDVFKCLYTLLSFDVANEAPDDTFRIRMICVLLETCGHFFHYGISKTRLDYYFIYLQYYYWQKRAAWIGSFPISVEYMMEDTWKALRPHFQICKTEAEAKEAFEKLQANLASKLGKHGSRSLATILEGDGEHDNEEDDEEEEGVDSDYERHSQSSDGERNSDSMDEETDADSDMNKKKTIDEEDAAFAEAMDKLVTEDIHERLKEAVKPQPLDIKVPYNVRNNMKKSYDQLQAEDKEKSGVNFIVLLRKGNKQQYKNLEIPLDSDLAKNLKSQESAVREEMERMKQLTLDINDRLEEEDYQEQVQSQSQATNVIKDKKKKYKHLRGAPDADMIFGWNRPTSAYK